MGRIGLDARTASSALGGIRSYAQGLIRGLADLSPSHSIRVVDRAEGGGWPFPIAVVRTPPHHRLERYSLSVELARYRLDLLHSIDFIPPLRGARRHVITVHDLAFLRFPEFLAPSSRSYYNAQIRTAVEKADRIVAVSRSTASDLVSLLDVSPEKVRVQPLGVDPRFAPIPLGDASAARARLALPERFFLFVGTLEPRKNVAGLLAGYARLRELLPDAPALVIGGRVGWLFDGALLEEERPGVTWLGPVPSADLPLLYALAEALVMPSHYEGFGLPALEAMACGTVPITSDVSSFPEVLGDVGLLVPPSAPDALAAALHRVATDDTWRAAQESAAIDRARTFTWERCAQGVLDVYEELLAAN